MIRNRRIGVVVPAAGKGRRMGGSQSKQLIELDGKPIILRTLEVFEASDDIDAIVLAVDPSSIGFYTELARQHKLSRVYHIVAGGIERQDSVWNGLQALRSEHIDVVLVHDAVRPFIEQSTIRAVAEAAIDHRAAIVAIPPKETIKISHTDGFASETPPREQLWIAQTPQAFQFDLFVQAYEKARCDHVVATDDAGLVERLGVAVKIVEGSYDNIKITTPDDLELAHLILQRRIG